MPPTPRRRFREVFAKIFRKRRRDQFGPKIVEIRTILAIFWPFEVFWMQKNVSTIMAMALMSYFVSVCAHAVPASPFPSASLRRGRIYIHGSDRSSHTVVGRWSACTRSADTAQHSCMLQLSQRRLLSQFSINKTVG